MKALIFTSVILFSITQLNAQVGIGTTTPQGALDITSANDGLLVPRIALTNTTTITVITPVASEIIYNTATINDVTPGYYYLSTATGPWVRFAGATGWLTTGNADIVDGTNFLGTTIDVDVAFRRNSVAAGKIGTVNTSFGVGALQSVTTGFNNVAFGTNALAASINGVENVAIGYNALSATTAFGANAAVGYANIAIGSTTLTSIAPGNDNVALGFQAMQNNTANATVGIGYRAAQNNTGDKLIAIGYNAGTNNSGLENIAIGENTLTNYTSGASRRNIAIGTLAMSGNTAATVSQNVALGYRAGNSLASSNNVVIGDNAMLSTSSGESNVAVGSGTMEQGNNSFNTAIGREALLSASGNNNVAIGYRAARNNAGTNTIAIGSDAVVTGSDQIFIGSGPVASQTATVNSALGWAITSDRRLKSNIQDSPLGLDFIKTIRPVSYYRKTDSEQKTEFGFIAQELETALNTSGFNNTGILIKTTNDMFAVHYNSFLPMTIKAVQEQQTQIEALQKQNAELKKVNAAILKRLEALEKN